MSSIPHRPDPESDPEVRVRPGNVEIRFSAN